MDLKDIPTKELVKELLLREPRGPLKIEVGRIMLIESYHRGEWVGTGWERKPIEFRIVAESHDEQTFTDIDEAVDAFFRWWKHGNETRT